MGATDSEDLLEAVEESFGVPIPPEDVSRIRTIGDLQAKVMDALGDSLPRGCLTARAFYALRRGLSEVLHTPRERIRPSSETADLLPFLGRRKTWRRLGDALGLKLPRLYQPLPILGLAAVALFILAMPYLIITRWSFSVLGAWVCGTVAVATMGPFALWIPRECETVGELASSVLVRNFSALAADGCTPEDVLNSLKLLVAESFAVWSSELTADTDFVKDLNFD